MNDELSDDIKSAIVSNKQRELDLRMVPYDIWGTRAHVVMLAETGIVDRDVATDILQALEQIEESVDNGEYEIDPDKGAHLSLESHIIDRAGEQAGLSTHTARSRNDQVMVTELLYLRERVLDVLNQVGELMDATIDLAGTHRDTVMPGYTHMQPAKPTTFTSWCLAYANAFHRSAQNLMDQYERFDRCPLGAVESYGTSWPIDRERTAELLGFSQVWTITQDVVSSRGQYQYALLTALNELMLTAGKAASDLLLYSTHESDYVDFGENVTQRLHPITGSSVMAQKKNPDALELVRGTAPQLAGMLQSVTGLLSGLPTGYNRDSREVKEYITNGLSLTETGLSSLIETVSTLQVHEDKMLEAVEENYSLTTDIADGLAQETGIPYRKMYDIVGEAVNQAIKDGRSLSELSQSDIEQQAQEEGVELSLEGIDLKNLLDPETALSKRTHTGGTAPEELDHQMERLRDDNSNLADWVDTQHDRINEARDRTRNAIRDITRGS